MRYADSLGIPIKIAQHKPITKQIHSGNTFSNRAVRGWSAMLLHKSAKGIDDRANFNLYCITGPCVGSDGPCAFRPSYATSGRVQ